jgi:YfiH family protein
MAIEHHRVALRDGGAVHVVATGKRDGDLAIDGPPSMLAARRTAIVDRPWTWLRQVHGAQVVDGDLADAAGASADAAAGTAAERAFAVHTADCAPVALVAPAEGLVAVAHAGWRGLVDGVVEASADRLRAAGATELVAVVGPCISAAAYEFGADDLDVVAGVYGDAVRAVSAAGAPALDLRVGLLAAFDRAAIEPLAISTRCTATDAEDLFSHRARRERGRQALVVWQEPA